MMQLSCDLWSLLLPPEWRAEQEEDSIFIVDEDEISIVEFTVLMPEKGVSVAEQLKSWDNPQKSKIQLADFDALYEEFIDEDMFWREWLCDCGDFILLISHGCDIEHQRLDDSSVDEILSSLMLNQEGQ